MTALEEKLAELNAVMAERKATKKILDEQQRKLQVNLRRCHVEMEKRSKEHAALKSKIEELELYDDSSQREMRGLIKEKQNAMVSISGSDRPNYYKHFDNLNYYMSQ